MVARISRIAVIFSVLSIIPSGVFGSRYVWPIVGSRLLSSTFSEYREGHYHAGLDIRTLGRTGFPAVAVADGYVKRIKISPYGYGKALYLKLDDGNTAVYAHLSDFSRRCDSLAFYWRLEHRSAYCDLRLERGVFTYSAGDTIAYTGRSGTAAPHLHFELRDSSEKPFNPLMEAYKINDNEAPIIAELVVYPLGMDSRVEGSPLETRYYFSADGYRNFVLDDTLQLDGCFGFGAIIWDEQGVGSYYLAPYEVKLTIDGLDLYTKSNESFSYEHTSDVELEFREALNFSRRNTELLFASGNIWRDDRIGDGRIGLDGGSMCPEGIFILDKGLHKGEIVARDANGNTSIASFYFYSHRYPVVEDALLLKDSNEVVIATADPDGGETTNSLFIVNASDSLIEEVKLHKIGRHYKGEITTRPSDSYMKLLVRDDEGAVLKYLIGLQPSNGKRLYCEAKPVLDSGRFALRVRFDRGVQDLPVIRRISVERADTAFVCRINEREVVALLDPGNIDSGVNLFEINARGLDGSSINDIFAFTILKLRSHSSRQIMLGGERRVDIEASSLRSELIVLEREVNDAGLSASGIKRVSPIFELDFEKSALLQPIALRSDFGKGIALFKWDTRKGWEFIGTPFLEGGRVNVSSPGIYAYFKDGLPPLLGGVFAEEMSGGSGFFRKEWIYCSVDDEGSGVDPYSTFVEVNGKWFISEWDQFRKRLYIPIPSDFPAGRIQIRVEASDMVGNRASGEYDFLIK